jgi:uncharacterized membrane protein YfcA
MKKSKKNKTSSFSNAVSNFFNFLLLIPTYFFKLILRALKTIFPFLKNIFSKLNTLCDETLAKMVEHEKKNRKEKKGNFAQKIRVFFNFAFVFTILIGGGLLGVGAGVFLMPFLLILGLPYSEAVYASLLVVYLQVLISTTTQERIHIMLVSIEQAPLF